MKYVYKQMLAFLIIFVVTVLTTGIIFIRFFVTNIYDEKERQLFGYAEAIIEENMTLADISTATAMISKQDVIVAMYNKNDRLVYPISNQTYSSGLSDRDWNRLVQGNRIALRQRDRGFMNEEIAIVTVYVPLFNYQNGDFEGTVAVAAPISGIKKDISHMQSGMLWATLISGGMAILFSIGFANYLSQRIVRMRKATNAITQGDFEIYLEDYGRDEFDELSRDFNKMVTSLKESNAEIMRQENLRRQFMMDVAHEMRTPLTTINGILEGLEHDMIPEKRRARSIEMMHKETRRMIRMVNENLDYEKMRSEQIVLTKQILNAQEILQTVKEQLQTKASSKGNTIGVSVSSPHLTIYADYDRLIQMLVNLTNNAIQFTENGRISLTAHASDGFTVIKVSDTGIGMKEEEIPAIWERFYKTDPSRRSDAYSETGIGLAIVKSLVANHGGEITVTSKIGKGTVFTIQLPNKENRDSQ